ncbi:M50 family metallopeptidase [Marivirga salinae]|uniref:M50 family metallopeptidase n=1 Tax=Marivirga salinarum TaxID=3059078 RepID=A0AA51N9X9_9BACT|nr:M50 family metallopeptidase [Marivirga sp. BDSF4-3]WMN11541.1 M50 family metallopeptidase [Marivirga sp. BDSF4-3]
MTIKIIETFCTIVMVFIVLGVHELGHLITGLKLGFRFELFVVGPLGIKKNHDKIRVYLNKNVAHYGGLAATLPTEDKPDNIKKLAIICLAGPIASIVFAVILAALYLTTEFQFSKVLLVGALASLGIFLVTTIPNKTGMFFTDRKRYERLTKNGPERSVELALLRILGNYAKDNSYVNINEDDIELLISDEHYKFFGLFTKLTYQFEKEGNYNLDTKEQYDSLSELMPKSMVKAMNMQLVKLRK